jgi:hypothetical protein
MDMIFVCGGNAADIKAGALSVRPDLPVHIYEDRETLTGDLIREIRDNDILLVKGSHAFEMGKAADAVMEKMSDDGAELSGNVSLFTGFSEKGSKKDQPQRAEYAVQICFARRDSMRAHSNTSIL